MPSKKLRVRVMLTSFRCKQLPLGIQHSFHPCTIIHLTMNQNGKIICEANQSTVEHPMSGA